MDKQTVTYSRNGIILCSNKEQIANTCNITNESKMHDAK